MSTTFHWPQPWPPHTNLMPQPLATQKPSAPPAPETVDMFDGEPTA